MKKIGSSENLTMNDCVWMSANRSIDIRHFNVFYVRHTNNERVNCKQFSRKSFYKISLLKGKTRLYYADKTTDFDCGLLFTHPTISYSWEFLESDQIAYFCIYTDEFFDPFIPIQKYPVFQPGHMPLFPLSLEQFTDFENLFKQMLSEIALEFSYKYDSLRALVLQLIFTALKLEPSSFQRYSDFNGSQRIAFIFIEHLERQFLIESTVHRIALRYPTDYATQLSIHVNYLNHALKLVTGKTTSQLIEIRLMQEARILLQHTGWTITEIAWCLGFDELPHFSHFFKQSQQITPTLYRKKQTS